MGLLALDHLLGGQPMQTRFAGDPALQATMLLLQERVPQTGVLHVSPPAAPPATSPASDGTDDDGRLRVFPTAASTTRGALLSNGRYVMVTNAGGGYSRRGDDRRDPLASRPRPATTPGCSATCATPTAATSGRRPTSRAVTLDDYQAIFSDAKAEFRGTARVEHPHRDRRLTRG